MIDVTEDEIVASLHALSSNILEGAQLNREWIIIHKWAAVPMWKWPAIPGKDNHHFLDWDAERITDAAQRDGCAYCYAIPVDGNQSGLRSYRVDMVQDDLLNFSWECAGSSYLLMPEDRSFAILCSAKDYNIVAGSNAFVSRSLRARVTTAHKEFLNSAEFNRDYEHGGDELVNVARRYEPFIGVIITEIVDGYELNVFSRTAKEMYEETYAGTAGLNLGWALSHGWAIVPIESGVIWNERLIEAAILRGCNECIAYSLEGVSECYRVPMTGEGILSLRKELGGLNYLLFPENRDFVILNTSDDHDLICGPRDFVTAVLGCSIQTARDVFLKRFADDPLWGEKQRAFLLWIADRYNSLND